jgi:hypothetical protein
MKRKPHDQLVTPAGQEKLKSFGRGTEFDHGPTGKTLNVIVSAYLAKA